MKNKVKANVIIEQKNGKLHSVFVNMPIWVKEPTSDGIIKIDLPFFGIDTLASDSLDIDESIEDILHLFYISCEKFGKGLITELQILGWDIEDESEDKIVMEYMPKENNVIFEQMMSTGEIYEYEDILLELT